jgi:hypothetical protein
MVVNSGMLFQLVLGRIYFPIFAESASPTGRSFIVPSLMLDPSITDVWLRLRLRLRLRLHVVPTCSLVSLRKFWQHFPYSVHSGGVVA